MGINLQNRLRVSFMIRRNMPDVLEIEHACFESPWTEREFINTLRQRKCVGQVAEVNGEVQGFIIYELHKDHYSILNLAVHPRRWREGIAGAMVQHLKTKVHRQPARNYIDTNVSEAKVDAHLFFKANHFRCNHIHKEYFDDGQDAYHFVWKQPRLEPEE